MVFEFFGAKKKVVIGMAHIGALPGAPLYDADGGMPKLIEAVRRDIEALQSGGIDAVMFGNENDRPYLLAAPAEGSAAMTATKRASSSAKRRGGCSRRWGFLTTRWTSVFTSIRMA